MKRPLQYTLLLITLFVPGIFTLHAQVQTGKSYINVTKGSTGGTFEPGDILEIRSAISVKGSTISDVRYNDTIDNNFTYISNSLKIITNEGLTFRAYTDAAADDAAMYNTTNKNLRINLGSTAGICAGTGNAAATGGAIAATNKPSFFGSVCIMVASFRVVINSSLTYNTIITLPGGAFRYTNSGSPVAVNFAPNEIMLFQNLGSCNNFVGSNAIIENNGTFGSGITQNRSASAIVPGYTFTPFTTGQPNDGLYGIANNTSATAATDNGVAYPHATRVFTLWDIIGDHTGAASPTAGNAPAAPGTIGGYMAIVNASYATSPAIQQAITNVCTNTYYDFSAWFRNICSLCASDSNGKGATNAAFNGPYKPGVKPNLTFQLDGVDYYTTGDLPYTQLWEKKGFTYLTSATQTAFTLTIRNNSPGGGGNDWAVDDVSLSTCEPNVNLNITPVLMGCDSIQVDFKVKVNCYFPNYTFYKWQKSLDGGTTWMDTGISGTGTPTLVGSQWEYTATYPTFIATLLDSGQRYRVIAATSASNLGSTACAYSNNQSTMLKIIDCAHVLKVQLVSFSGQLINNKSLLNWASSTENNISHYEVERSSDGKTFYKAGSVKGSNNTSGAKYSYADEEEINAAACYRLKIIDKEGLFKYSETILLSNKKTPFAVSNFTNPFRNFIDVAYVLPTAAKVNFSLADAYGKAVYQQTVSGKKGLNNTKLATLSQLAAGIYTITIFYENVSITKRVLKIN